jgi:poly(3-hydroxybutyrate) depolymerase
MFHYDVEGAGHYGIFAGRRWRDMAYPVVRDFIARYNVTAQAESHQDEMATEAALQVAAAPSARASAKRPARKSGKTAQR